MCNLAYISAISQARHGFICNWILSQMVGLNCIWFPLTTNRTHTAHRHSKGQRSSERTKWKTKLPSSTNIENEKMFINLKFLDIKWLWRVAHTCGVASSCTTNVKTMSYDDSTEHMWYWIHCARFLMNSLPRSFGFQFSIFSSKISMIQLRVLESQSTSQVCSRVFVLSSTENIWLVWKLFIG